MARYWAGYQWRDHHDEIQMRVTPAELRSVPLGTYADDLPESVCETCSGTYVLYHTEDDCIANLMKDSASVDQPTDDQYVGAE